MRLKKLNSATNICKICFKPIIDQGFRFLLFDEPYLCRRCYEELKPAFIRYKINGVKCLSLFFYNDKIQSLLYQFKGTFDYELKDIFISYCVPLLRLYFRGYKMIPVPSSKEVNERRGFNQVIEMFKLLKLPMIFAIKKTCNHIQHEGNTKERRKVKDVLAWEDGVKIDGQKVLLVDDVFTTGSTIRACLKLIKKHNPKRVKVLTMAKTRDLNDRNN